MRARQVVTALLAFACAYELFSWYDAEEPATRAELPFTRIPASSGADADPPAAAVAAHSASHIASPLAAPLPLLSPPLSSPPPAPAASESVDEDASHEDDALFKVTRRKPGHDTFNYTVCVTQHAHDTARTQHTCNYTVRDAARTHHTCNYTVCEAARTAARMQLHVTVCACRMLPAVRDTHTRARTLSRVVERV